MHTGYWQAPPNIPPQLPPAFRGHGHHLLGPRCALAAVLPRSCTGVYRCRHQTAEQYERYVNRFGPGLVIYWHGYIADLNRVGGCIHLTWVW